MKLEEIEDILGIMLHPHQREFLEQVPAGDENYRACLYYRTGAGKTLTSLAAVVRLGYDEVLVIAPPSTQDAWEAQAALLGLKIQVMSHAKFRMAPTKISRSVPIVADEFHMFGGNQAQGWKKLEVVARGLKAPLLLLSATPNYNDAERCYCVLRLLDPAAVKGGYLQFLYDNCLTKQDPFSMTPKVEGFRNHADAAEFLASLPHVFHLPDEREVGIDVLEYEELVDINEEFGYDIRNHRMIASLMEMRHARRFQGLVTEEGLVRPEVLDPLMQEISKATAGQRKVLIYCNHSTVAVALSDQLNLMYREHLLLTGKSNYKEKRSALAAFRKKGGPKILIGTAALATGTDGLDKVCDTLIILDNTDDDALRRQLIGRILPRGGDASVEGKKVLLFSPV